MSASALPRAIPTRFGPRSEICSSFPGSQQPESPTFESLISEMAFGLPSAPVNSQSVFQTLAAERPPWTRALGMMELSSPPVQRLQLLDPSPFPQLRWHLAFRGTQLRAASLRPESSRR